MTDNPIKTHSATVSEATVLYLGNVSFNQQTGRVDINGELIRKMSPRLKDLLKLFMLKNGYIVTRDEVDACVPMINLRKTSTYNDSTVTVSRLNSFLSKSQANVIILHVPRRGYTAVSINGLMTDNTVQKDFTVAAEEVALKLGNLVFYTNLQEVTIGGEFVRMEAKVKKLLEFLMLQNGEAVTNVEIDEHITAPSVLAKENARTKEAIHKRLSNPIHQLRKLLKSNKATVRIETVWGTGQYKLIVPGNG